MIRRLLRLRRRHAARAHRWATSHRSPCVTTVQPKEQP